MAVTINQQLLTFSWADAKVKAYEKGRTTRTNSTERQDHEGTHVARQTLGQGGKGPRPCDPGTHGCDRRITSTAICGSDLHLYEVLGPYIHQGDILGPRTHGHRGGGGQRGHQPEKRRPRGVPFNISCGHCYMCRQGLQSQCETTQEGRRVPAPPSWVFPSSTVRFPAGRRSSFACRTQTTGR